MHIAQIANCWSKTTSTCIANIFLFREKYRHQNWLNLNKMILSWFFFKNQKWQLTDYLHGRMRRACKEERRDILEVLNDIKTARAVTRKIRRQISDNVTTKQTSIENDNLPSFSRIVRSHSFANSRLGKMILCLPTFLVFCQLRRTTW